MSQPSAASTTLGAAIRGAREAGDLSRELVAEKTGYDLSTIQRAESGTTDIHVATLVVIADALGVRPADLLAEVTAEMVPPRVPRSANRKRIKAERAERKAS